MKKNATAKALIMSVLALMLCLSMLVGTTFAWFTDSVKSGVNKIVAGNLDVELEYATAFDENGNPIQWAAVTEDTQLFSDKEADGTTINLWEPGHTEVVYLRIRNAGTLALKYKLAVTVNKEDTVLKNVNGEKFKLSDYLVFGQKESDSVIAKYATREDAWAAVGETMGLKQYSKESDRLLPGIEEYVALVVYIPTSVGNEANPNNKKNQKTIELGVSLIATQTPYESDHFDENYDEGTNLNFVMTSLYTEVYGALNAGKSVSLSGDAVSPTNKSSTLYVTGKKEATLSLNGYSVTNTRKSGNCKAIYAQNEGTVLTIEGSGTIDGGSGATTNNAVYASDKAKIIIKGGNYTVGAAKDGSGNACILADSGSTIEIEGGFFETKVAYDGKYWVLNLQDNTDSHIIVRGGTFVNFDPSHTGTEPEGVSDNFVAEGYKVVSEVHGDDTWYTVIPE